MTVTVDCMTEILLLWVMVVLMGLVFGSFATLVSYRLVAGGSIIAGRSRCPHCKTPLGVRDLVPLLSWLASKGRCRHCKTRIHWRYPLIECATASLFLLVFWQAGFTLPAVALSLFAVCLIVMTTVDAEHRIIPDEVQIVMAVLGVCFHLALATSLLTPLMGMLSGLFLGTALQKGYKWVRGRDGLGTGDVKFLTVAGIWLGAAGLVPLMLLSGVLGIFTALLWRLVSDDPRFPFGPALGIGTFLLVLFPELSGLFWRSYP